MKIAKLLSIAVFLAFVAIVSNVTPVVGDDKKENGKDLYKMDCKVCHEKGSPHGEYTPMSLTQDQWKKFFENKLAPTHKDVVLKSENKKLLEFLSPEQISKIKKFCVDHAADSEQPQTCSE
jgi:hypothetical protein